MHCGGRAALEYTCTDPPKSQGAFGRSLSASAALYIRPHSCPISGR
jgi:hypothetical protein